MTTATALKRRFTVDLDHDEYDQLQELAHKKRLPMTEVARQLFRDAAQSAGSHQ